MGVIGHKSRVWKQLQISSCWVNIVFNKISHSLPLRHITHPHVLAVARSRISLTPDVKDHAAAVLQFIQLCEAYDGIATFTLMPKKNSGRIQLEISVDFNQSWCGCNAVHTVVPTYCDMICGCVWQLEIHHPNGHEMSLRFYQQTNDRQWIDQNKHGEFNHEIVGLIMNRKGLNQNQVASKLEPHQPWTMVYHHQWF